jgi:predicted RNase H-like nuclease
MTTLLIGFDAAWTRTNAGAMAGSLRLHDGALRGLGPPHSVDYQQAAELILDWQRATNSTSTLVLLDQPTIVTNATGQRPVESLVSSLVSRRSGAMLPANTTRRTMFGEGAPVWLFLNRFGGPGDPLKPLLHTAVLETYPVLAIMALGWTLRGRRGESRLPKYNPGRRQTFSRSDWQHVSGLVLGEFRERGLADIADWADGAGANSRPQKRDQDKLDACLCLLVALYLVEQRDCLMVGNLESGYIVVPNGEDVRAELNARCQETGRLPAAWVRRFRMPMSSDAASVIPRPQR